MIYKINVQFNKNSYSLNHVFVKIYKCKIFMNPDIFSVYEKIELIKIGAATMSLVEPKTFGVNTDSFILYKK